MNNFFYTLFYPIEWLIAWIMVLFHKLFVLLGMPDGSGFAWALSIIFLTFFVRACIFPLYNKQMQSMARMQAIQPQLMKIQNKYRGKKDPASQEAMQRETMKLYKDNKSNPFSSCLPMLIQMPIFLALYNVLYAINKIAVGKQSPIGGFTKSVSMQISNTVFANAKLSEMWNSASGSAKWTIGIFVALMCLTMFLNMFYNTRHNTPVESMQGSQKTMQWSMMITFPLLYIFSGAVAPFGVLLYWLTSNIWTMGQTVWQLRHYPTPGSRAYKQKQQRDHDREVARRKREGLPTIEEEAMAKAQQEAKERAEKGYQRVQPVKRKSKKKGK